jgi:hypothetical protein
MMEVVSSSEILVPTYRTTRCHIAENRHLHSNAFRGSELQYWEDVLLSVSY